MAAPAMASPGDCTKLKLAAGAGLTAMLVVPCKGPLPAALAAVTTVLLSLLRRLPKASSIRMTGCWMKARPAVAVADGWVSMDNLLARAGLRAIEVEVAGERPM